MEQSITSEIDSIDKEIEALQKRKSQLQKSATEDADFMNVDRLIKSANFQLADKLEKDYLSFAASKECRIFEDEVFEIRLFNSETQSTIIRSLVGIHDAVKFITHILANAVAIDHIVSVLGDSIVDQSHMRDAIYVSTPNYSLTAKVSLSNETGRFDISIDDQLLSSADQVIISHNDCKDAWILVEGDNVKASFKCSIKDVEYEDIHSVLDDLDKAYVALTVYA